MENNFKGQGEDTEDSFENFLGQKARKKESQYPRTNINEDALDFTKSLEDFTLDEFKQIESQLTFMEIAFLNEYLTNGYNGTRAYLAVNKTSNFTNAASQASLILRRREVKSFIQLFRNAQLERFQITIESQLAEIEELIKSCKEEGLDGEGKLKDRANWLKAIQEKNKMAGFTMNKDEVKSTQPIEINFNLDPSTKIINIEPSHDDNTGKILPDDELPEGFYHNNTSDNQ